jgi:hypothetical protein
MRTFAWWVEWPVGVIRVGVVFLVLATLGAAVVRYPETVNDLGDEASRNSSLSYADREVAGGNGIVVDQAAVYAARSLIPPDEAFSVVVNPDFAAGSAETVPFVASYYRYFLVPRRMVEGAPWVICYACELGEYGDRAEVVWTGSDDISIVRVDR